jgi:hypothetical protein
MARRSTSYPDICRRRIRASKALLRLLAVANGKEEPNADRDRVCMYLLNKMLPDQRQDQLEQLGVLRVKWMD